MTHKQFSVVALLAAAFVLVTDLAVFSAVAL